MAYLVTETGLITGAGIIFSLKELLKSAGYTVLSSGDGLSAYDSSGDVITSSSSGANGMANLRAWFRIRSPDGVHEWVFQRGNNNREFRALCNFGGDPFSDGSPGINQTPDSADGIYTMGGGTSASPIYSSSLFNIDNSYFVKGLVDNQFPYTWWIGTINNSTKATEIGMMFDYVVATHPDDVYKFVYIHMGMNSPTVGWRADTNTSGVAAYPTTFYKTRVPSTTKGAVIDIGNVRYLNHNSQLMFSSIAAPSTGLSAHPITGKDTLLPIMYCNPNVLANSFYKGFGTLYKLKSTNRPTGTVLDLGGGSYGVVMYDYVVPWNSDVFDL